MRRAKQGIGVSRRGCRAALLLATTLLAASAAVAANLEQSPLSPRSGPRGATLFRPMTPAETGVVTENKYADPRMWGDLYQEFAVGAMGTGVAIGDYDNDGRPDLFIASKTESCRLFRNLGDFRFEDVTAKAGVGDEGAAAAVWKQGVAFADVNNDGWLDIYVCRFRERNLLYLNQHDGTFREAAKETGLDLVDASSAACFADYDRDGWLDVYIQTNLLDAGAHPIGQRDRLYRNNRDGTFTDVSDRAGIGGETQGHSATWLDFDEDGWPDLYVANDFAVPDFLYRNNRDGTFANVIEQVVPHTPYSSMGADLGDVDNDGHVDLFVADMAATTHQKDQRGMADSRARAGEDQGDRAEAPQYLRNALYLNTGLGRCLEASRMAGLAATDWTWSPRFEDLDNDGRLDLHVTNGMNREQHNTDLLNRMMLAESPAERIRLVRSSPVLTESNLAFRNRGELQFENVSAEWGLDHKGVSFGSAFGDLDGDGDLDFVYTNYQAGATVLRNDSDQGHRLVIALRGTKSNRFGVGATVRLEAGGRVQVRQLVVTRGYISSSEPILHFGLGDERVVQRMRVTWPSGAVQEFTQIDADQRLLVIEPDSATPAAAGQVGAPSPLFREIGARLGLNVVAREEIVDELSRQRLLPVRLNRRGPALAVADADGDGMDDLLISGTTADAPRLFRGEATGGHYSAVRAGWPTPPVNGGPVLVFDASGDDRNDLLLTAGGSALPAGSPEYNPTLLLGSADGTWKPAPKGTLPDLPISVGAAAAADFNRDGQLDVFLGGRVSPGEYPLPASSALLANRGGRFEDVTDAVAPGLRNSGMVTSALWTDVDGDGWIDLLVAYDWGPIRLWRNEGGRRLVDQSEALGFASAGTGWWTSLASADFNGDGRPDYVAGNLGLNTSYTATPQQPALLYVGDFNGTGQPQIVEGFHEGPNLFPRRTRRELITALPAIARKFPRNDAFARSTLPEIFGADKLAAAERFAATESRSGVFLSQPDGRFAFIPLPRAAQIAPAQGLVATDLDGDGCADIALTHNLFAPVPAVGRFDGGLGLVLLGDGRGGFRGVPPDESGLVVAGDAKALALADIDRDGRPDLIASRNNDTALVFSHAKPQLAPTLCISLRGKRGNRAAVGAALQMVMSDDTTLAGEIEGGSGFASQSTPAWFVGLRAGAQAKLVRVRWPDGRFTEHALAPGASGRITIQDPSAGQ